MNIFIIENLSHPIEILVSELFHRHPLENILCAMTPEIAKRFLKKFCKPGDIIVLDCDDGRGGSFHNFVPQGAWERTISISMTTSRGEFAFFKGARIIIPKIMTVLTDWSTQVVRAIKKLLPYNQQQSTKSCYKPRQFNSDRQFIQRRVL